MDKSVFAKPEDALITLDMQPVSDMAETKRYDGMAYSECAPSKNSSIVRQRQSVAIASGELDNNNSLGKGSDRSRSTFSRIETCVVVIVTIFVHITHATLPLCIASERSLIVDTPCQNFAVASESGHMHSTTCDMYNTNFVR